MELKENNIERLKILLDRLNNNLEKLSFDSFDSLFPVIVKNMQQLNMIKDSLLEQYGPGGLASHSAEIDFKAKEIERRFKNIVEVFSDEEIKLAKELSGWSGRRKIASYLKLGT